MSASAASSCKVREATSSSWPDAAHRHVQCVAQLSIAHRRVVNERQHEQSTARRELRKDLPQRLVAFAYKQVVIDRREGHAGQVLQILVRSGHLTICQTHDPHRLAASGRGQPSADPFRMRDAVQVLDQPQPSCLGDIRRVRGAESVGAARRLTRGRQNARRARPTPRRRRCLR